jgi:hypothetical protein
MENSISSGTQPVIVDDEAGTADSVDDEAGTADSVDDEAGTADSLGKSDVVMNHRVT